MLQRQEVVGDGLGFYPLGGIDDEDGGLAGGEGSADLVGEVHMARGVDEVQDIGLAIAAGVLEADGARLDGDAALALEVHLVEVLLPHLAPADAAGDLEEPVGESGLAVVDVGHDAEVAYPLGRLAQALPSSSALLPASVRGGRPERGRGVGRTPSLPGSLGTPKPPRAAA